MRNRVDDAIFMYDRDRREATQAALDLALVEEQFLVPVAEPTKELTPGHYDVPVLCVRTEAGGGAIPAFSSMERLLTWKPHGCLYTTLNGHSLLAMAIGMESVTEILVNPGSVPRGRIPRSNFTRMLAIQSNRSAEFN